MSSYKRTSRQGEIVPHGFYICVPDGLIEDVRCWSGSIWGLGSFPSLTYDFRKQVHLKLAKSPVSIDSLARRSKGIFFRKQLTISCSSKGSSGRLDGNEGFITSGKSVDADDEESFQFRTEWWRTGDNSVASGWIFGKLKSRARRLWL
jgi:hypothetical protein